MHSKIGHGHKESLNKGACVVSASNNHADFALGLWKNNNNNNKKKMNNLAYFHIS